MDGGVRVFGVRSFAKVSCVVFLAFVTSFAILQTVLVRTASARNYDECVDGGNSKFRVNTNEFGQQYPYEDMSDISPYGISWACSVSSNSSAAAVVWLASPPGAQKEGSNWYWTVYVNSTLTRSGTHTMYVVGTVNNLQSPPNVATQVRLCTDSSASSHCWTDVGITPGDGFNWSSSRSYWFTRADETSALNWWTDPKKAAISIDMDKLLSSNPEIDTSHEGYDIVWIYMHRKFGDSGSDGVTPMKLLIKKSSAATFSGSVTATAKDTANNASVSSTTNNPGAGQTLTVSGDSYSITFDHAIERTDSGNHSVDNDWSTTINPTSKPNSVNALGTASYGTVTTTTKTTYGVRSYSYSGRINPGQTITYCETLNYNSKRGSGVATENSSKTSCVKVKREPEATFTADVTATVSNGSATVTSATNNPGDAQTLTVGGENYTVRFKHVINRTDSLGHTAVNSWSTSVSPSSRPNSANAVGTAVSNKTVSTAAQTGYEVRNYTYSGKLYAGQTITYCETLNYDTFIATGKTTQHGSKTTCIKVKRTSSVCASLKGDLSGTVYSMNKGFNYGQIGVKNRNINDNYTYYGSYNTSGAIEIYARPGDEIKFQHNMCAGGVYARAVGAKETVNGSYNYSGTSDSTEDAGVKSRYLFGEQVSGWNASTKTSSPKNIVYTNVNDSNITSQILGDSSVSPGENAYYNNCLTGGSTTKTNGFYKIAGGTNASTCDNRVKTLDTGHTITQSLTWTNLGYDNGVKSGGNNVSATASVKVPYNYVLAPYVDNSAKVAFLGGSVVMTPGIVVRGRVNAAFGAGSSAYATITKPSEITVKYYFKTASGSVIAQYDVEENRKSNYRMNQTGSLAGSGNSANASNMMDDGGSKLRSVSIAIPDDGTIKNGDKVCVEVSAYPADSHDDKNASTVYGAGVGDIALSEGGNSSNTAIAISCSTIAKMPAMSVESSNAYSASQFKTAYYTKRQNGQNNRYGSWAEYGVFGGINATSLFASGAALGYSRVGYPQTSDANIVRVDNGATAVATKENSNKCTFMTQTFANTNCETSASSVGGVSASQYEQRMKDRYMKTAASFELNGLSKRNFGGTDYYDVSGYSGSDIIESNSGIVRFSSSGNLYVNSLPNLTDQQFADKGVENRNRTIVYSLPGKSIVIDGNIGAISGALSTIDNLPQVIIFAKNVYITDQPTYINAIIIADEVNTCKFVGGAKVAIGGKGGAGTINDAQCNAELRFDSPVVVKRLVLNRTHGGDGGIASIIRAEIFNLNTANYLWSFNQMSRLSQATTTYLREMPTRY